MKKWDQLLVEAAPLVNYLSRTSYFDKAYSGIRSNRLILTDAIAARAYATDDSFETFEGWETVSDSGCEFPEPDLVEWMKNPDLSKSPPNMTWHHNEEIGLLNLMSFDDHRDNHGIYHPDGTGGKDKWGAASPAVKVNLVNQQGAH